ncbi:MAG TPA: response regulator [bacterium]|nr:response regulator [bacterium]HPP30526.1 response regulator [bacterium]
MGDIKNKLNVMVIEDDDMTRKLLVIELKRRGHNVLEYTDAAAAMLDLERDKKPIDAAIVDLMNMGYGGNIGEYLRKKAEYKDVAIFFYTALTKQQFNTKILDIPNTHYIHKEPGSIKVMIEKIESLFNDQPQKNFSNGENG